MPRGLEVGNSFGPSRLKRWLGQEGNARDLGRVILKKLAGQRGLPD